jgi:hypothetical protein
MPPKLEGASVQVVVLPRQFIIEGHAIKILDTAINSQPPTPNFQYERVLGVGNWEVGS